MRIVLGDSTQRHPAPIFHSSTILVLPCALQSSLHAVEESGFWKDSMAPLGPSRILKESGLSRGWAEKPPVVCAICQSPNTGVLLVKDDDVNVDVDCGFRVVSAVQKEEPE